MKVMKQILQPMDIAAIEAFGRDRAEFHRQRSQLMSENVTLRAVTASLEEHRLRLLEQRASWRGQGLVAGIALAAGAYVVGSLLAGWLR